MPQFSKNCACLVLLVIVGIFHLFSSSVYASDNFVSVVNPVRGDDFWELKDQTPVTAVKGQAEITKKLNIPVTWLIRYDALNNQEVLSVLKSPKDEVGLFLEVIPTWTQEAGVEYHKSKIWHSAGSVFLTGYKPEDRQRLINKAFERFQSLFGYFPKSVGAWWIDSSSLDYMQKKYGITSALIVADQYSTDNYQIWGQYWGTPYYPYNRNTLLPASNPDDKIPVVVMQWATRDPVNGYGKGVEESTLSVQANDYIDYHQLGVNYYNFLVDTYTKQKLNSFNQLTVGLENSYSWSKYKEEYTRQMESLAKRSGDGQFKIVAMQDFADWYKSRFPQLSPAHLIVADDPLGSNKKSVWFMNPFYRVGWIYNGSESTIRDIRQYSAVEELCYSKSCQEINFATSATRVLDSVTFGKRWIIDEGKIDDFSISADSEQVRLFYTNELGKRRSISFLERDLSLDDKVFSIDGAILKAVSSNQVNSKNENHTKVDPSLISRQYLYLLGDLGKFLLFLIVIYSLGKAFSMGGESFLTRFFTSISLGMVLYTLAQLVIGILNLRWLSWGLVGVSVVLLFKYGLKVRISFKDRLQTAALALIIAGTVFQVIPVFRSGLINEYGLSFWGPNAHDGLWHVSLIEQLSSVPPENPIFSGELLRNYHYFYDLLLAGTKSITGIDSLNLVFRFYPIIFSLLLGVGTYSLINLLFLDRLGLFKTRVAQLVSIYLVYFGGSFGWIVEFIRERHFGGESSFWSSQPVSFNLNPPFAISLVLVICLFHFIYYLNRRSSLKNIFIIIFLVGSLTSFKAYAGILAFLVLGVWCFVGLFKKQLSYFGIMFGSGFLLLLTLLPNYSVSNLSSGLPLLFIWNPFWFIHSMIDSPDRVGWERLSLARYSAFETKNWLKFIGVESFGLFLFIAGNLGVRVIGLVIFIRSILVHNNSTLSFIILFGLFSAVFPILFIQSGNPWNTIQFFYYFIFIVAIFTGVLFAELILAKELILKLVVIILLFIAPINSLVIANSYLSYSPHTKVDASELEALKFLKEQPKGIILSYPYDKELKSKFTEPLPVYAYETTAYLSALTDKPSFVADEIQNIILGNNYIKRLALAKNFFLNPEDERRILNDNNIEYVYIIKKVYDRGLDDARFGLKEIFSNDGVVIYKTLD